MSLPTSIRHSLVLAALLLLIGTTAHAADFNPKYAPPFGNRVDARIENTFRASYLYGHGDIEGDYKGYHGGIFGLSLGWEDSFSFDIASTWKVFALTYENDCLDKNGNRDPECSPYILKDNGQTNVVIGLTPKYRFFDQSWDWGSIWMSFAINVNFPIRVAKWQSQLYEVNPGLQFYFDLGKWFGIELDDQFLLTINDPDEKPHQPGSGSHPDDDRSVVLGNYVRLNLLLKILSQHFLCAYIEDTEWFRSVDGAREQEVRRLVKGHDEKGNKILPQSEKDKLDMMFFANHQVNVGGGYRVNLKVAELGVGAWGAVVQTDRRQQWGLDTDIRFTF